MLFQKSSGVNITRHDYIFLLEIKEINDHVINSVAYEQAWRYQQRIRPVMHLMKCLIIVKARVTGEEKRGEYDAITKTRQSADSPRRRLWTASGCVS